MSRLNNDKINNKKYPIYVPLVIIVLSGAISVSLLVLGFKMITAS